MTFRFGGSFARRDRTMPDDYLFEWRPRGRDDGPTFPDLSWDFEEPDRYPALVAEQKPGMMASKGEKAFHATVASGDPVSMLQAGNDHPKYRDAAKTIAGLMMLESEMERGIALLEEVVAAGTKVEKDHFLRKYLHEAGLTVVIAAGVTVHLPLQRNSLILLLAELHQARDEAARALQLLEMAEQTSHIRLSQTELLFVTDQFDQVLALTHGAINDDDVTALMLAYRGRALGELGRDKEAISVLSRALEFPNRAESIKAIALVGKGLIHQARGEHILARNDFTLALMEVPTDHEAQEHIQELIRGDTTDP